jgi:hypothetical protein
MKYNIFLLKDVAVPSDRNAIQESEKKLKYKNLSIEIPANVEHEMFCRTSNHWNHRNCN